MSLSVTKQKFKGDVTKIVVRDGRGVLMTLPPSDQMHRLALKMAQEGNEKGESGYLALVHKYTDLRDKLLSDPARVDDTSKIPPIVLGNVTTEDVEKAQATIKEKLADAFKSVTGVVTAQPPTLAELLEAARQAEIALAEVREQHHHICVALNDKENGANSAWKAFNEALRASLPDDNRVFGVSLNMLPWGQSTKADTE